MRDNATVHRSGHRPRRGHEPDSHSRTPRSDARPEPCHHGHRRARRDPGGCIRLLDLVYPAWGAGGRRPLRSDRQSRVCPGRRLRRRRGRRPGDARDPRRSRRTGRRNGCGHRPGDWRRARRHGLVPDRGRRSRRAQPSKPDCAAIDEHRRLPVRGQRIRPSRCTCTARRAEPPAPDHPSPRLRHRRRRDLCGSAAFVGGSAERAGRRRCGGPRLRRRPYRGDRVRPDDADDAGDGPDGGRQRRPRIRPRRTADLLDRRSRPARDDRRYQHARRGGDAAGRG